MVNFTILQYVCFFEKPELMFNNMISSQNVQNLKALTLKMSLNVENVKINN